MSHSSPDLSRQTPAPAVPFTEIPFGAANVLDPRTVRTSDPRWLLQEEGFTLAREHEVESLFAIGNGYVGNRGSLAEGSPLSAPATFVAGIFEQLDTPGAVPQLMTMPDWTGVKIWVDDEPLSMEHGELLEHRRILDFYHGMLWREWRQRDPRGRITHITAVRLASLHDRHLLLHTIKATAENYSAVLRFESSMEVGAEAVTLPAPEWKPRRSSGRPNVFPLALRPPGRDTSVVFGVTSQMCNAGAESGLRNVDVTDRHVVERCETHVQVGTDYLLHRLISVHSSRDVPNPLDATIAHLQQALPRGAGTLMSEHISAWQSRWHDSDVEVAGDDALQCALRFAGYHLISAANPADPGVSIGARALTGSAY